MKLDPSIERAAEAVELSRSRWPFEKKLDYWKSEEGCTLISGFVRDGMKPSQIASRIGVTLAQFTKWMQESPEINRAVREGSELNDYRVESALLKSALGYKARNVTVTTEMRYGKVVSTTKTEEEVDVPPNINAVKTWLYNRKPDTWMPESKIAGSSDDTDDSIQVEIVQADYDAEKLEQHSRGNRDDMMRELEAETSGEPQEGDLDYWPDDWEDEEDDWE